MTTDMTKGRPAGILVRFTLPMLLSVAFQQLYNISDSVIAGKFAGEDALAAVGASFPVTMIFMAFALGCNIGCSVVISQLFGAGDLGNMKTAVNTSILSVGGLSLLLTILGSFFGVPILAVLGTPSNIFGDSALYLNVYTWGLPFLFLYNIASGIFTALGDSRTPLYFLIASSLGNIGLDLLFVAVFHMGVAGVAWATFLAQGAASVFALVAVLRRVRRMESKEPGRLFSFSVFRKIAVIAVPSILQQSFISVGNLFIQNLVNGFGSSVIAGYSAAVKLNTFALTSFTALSNSLSSFTAQNIGAGKPERVKRGFRSGLIMALLVALPFTAVYCFLSSGVLTLFMDTASVQAMQAGTDFLRIVTPFYLFIAVKLMADGILRGAGAMKCFMVATCTDRVLRVVLAYLFSAEQGARGSWMSWPAGWVIASVLSCVFYFTGVWIPKRFRISFRQKT